MAGFGHPRRFIYRQRPERWVDVIDADTEQRVMSVQLPEGALRVEDMAVIERELRKLAEDEKGVEPEYVKIEVVGWPDEDLPRGSVLLVHPDVSLEVDAEELARALRPFVRSWGGR